MLRSARPSGRRFPAPPRSSLHSAFPRCRMPTASLCWITVKSMVWAPTKSCSRPTPSIRKFTTARPRAAATLTNREVNSNGSGKRSSRPRPPHGRPPAQSGKSGQAAGAHHGRSVPALSAPLHPCTCLHRGQRAGKRSGKPVSADFDGRLHRAHDPAAGSRFCPAGCSSATGGHHLRYRHSGRMAQRPYHGQRDPGHPAQPARPAFHPHGKPAHLLF